MSDFPRGTTTDLDLSAQRRFCPPWIGVALGIAVIFAGTFLYFLSAPVSARAFLFGDAWIFSLPNQFFLDSSIHRGEFPFWNPLAFCGTPFAADPQVLAFYPLNLLRSLLTFSPTPFRTQTTWNILLFIHFQIAGLGMYFLARQYGLSRPAAWTALIAYICSSQFVFNMVTWVYHIANVSWLPWILYFLNMAFSSNRFRTQLHYAVCAGAVYGMQLLGGGPVFMVLSTLLAGAALIMNIVWPTAISPRRNDIVPVQLTRRLSRNVVLFGLFMGIGLLLSSPYLVASTEFASQSIRANLVMDSYRNTFIPQCTFSLRDMFELSFVYTATRGKPAIVFSGACVTVLALAALLHSNRRATFFFAFLFFALADVIRLGRAPAIETPLAFLLDKITPFNVLRTEGWICTVLIGLPLGMLAGFGVDAIANARFDSKRARLLFSTAVVYLGVVALASIAGWVPELPLARNAGGLSTQAASVLYCALPFLFFLALIIATWRPAWRRWAFVLPVFAFCETVVWNTAIPQKVETYDIFPCALPMERLFGSPRWPDNNLRLGYRTQDCAMLGLHPNIGGYNPIYLAASGRTLLKNANYETDYTRFMESDSAGVNLRWNQIFKRRFWLSRQIVADSLPPMDTLFPAATTVFMPSPPPDTSIPIVRLKDVEGNAVSAPATKIPLPIPADPVTQTTPPAVWNLPAFHPPAQHSVLCLRVASNSGGAIRVTGYSKAADTPLFLRETQIPPEPRDSLLIEVPLPEIEDTLSNPQITFAAASTGGSIRLVEAYILSDTQDENDLIQVASLRANSVEVHIAPLPESRILTFVDAGYPGWQAYVDSRPAPMYVANDAFKSVVLGPGPHTVRFVYSPYRIYAGLIISGITAVLVSAYLVQSTRRMRRERSESPPVLES